MSETRKVIQFDDLGGPDVLKLVPVPLADPGKDEVRIRVQAMSLNRADSLFREGNYIFKPSLPGSRIGTDAAGVIEAVGNSVSGLAVGDRVMTGVGFDVSLYGVHGETAVLPAKDVQKYPEFLTPEEAAAVSIPFITAWGALNDYGEMKAGDHVLITAASSSVGVAAIQLANAAGAIPIAVTRTATKRQGLFEVGAKYVIVTDEEDIASRVAEITAGVGARLIFDPIIGGMLETLGDAAASGGTVFLYGSFGEKPAVLPVISTMTKEISFRGYVVYGVFNSPERLQRAYNYIFGMLEAGKTRVVIDKVFPLESYADAHRYLESNEQIGRIVIKV